MAVNGKNLFAGGNIVDMLTRSSLLGFIAIGQTLVVLCRSLDLSVGYVAALSSLVAATTMAGEPSRVVLGVAAEIGRASCRQERRCRIGVLVRGAWSVL